MDNNDLVTIHGLVKPEDDASYARAANHLLDVWGSGERVSDKDEAQSILSTAFFGYLHEFEWTKAALLAWGGQLVNPEPESVRLILGMIERYNKILVLGGGAQGKTYTACWRFLLRWVLDPKYTLIKLVSTTGGHARSNMYSTFVRLHKESIIPLPGIVRQDYIGLSTNDMHSAISRVAIQPGESGEAALRGFHPLPRGENHPLFGDSSFSIAIFDEADGIPRGAWKGADNMASTRNVQIYAATNPTNINSEFGIRAEPSGGWGEFDRETKIHWEGQQGWQVLRLDPAKSENVVKRRLIHPNFMDYEGFKTYESKGTNHPDYDIFGRGRYPSSTAQYNVIPIHLLSSGFVGSFHFVGATENWATFDGGYALGGDAAMFTTGRFGPANSFTDESGKEARFQPKWVGIAEQQFSIERVIVEGEPNSILMGDNLIEICKRFHIRPEWFVMDKTGNSLGVYDYLKIKFGGILGIEWGEKATEMKVMEQDSKTAEEQFSGITSEMWFATSLWIEYGNFKLAPTVQRHPLFGQLSNRKYTYASKTLRLVESKADYKKNNREESPNEADSLIMAPQLFRERTAGRPSMIEPPPQKQRKSLWDFTEPEKKKLEPRPNWVKV